MWRERMTVTRDGRLVAMFMEGERPTYHADGRDHETVLALVGGPGRLANGLPVDAAIAGLVEAGFTVTCRVPRVVATRSPPPATVPRPVPTGGPGAPGAPGGAHRRRWLVGGTPRESPSRGGVLSSWSAATRPA